MQEIFLLELNFCHLNNFLDSKHLIENVKLGFNQFFLPFIKFVSSNCNIFDNAPDSELKIYPKNWDTKLTAAFISANMD